jgi:hypothetical protein
VPAPPDATVEVGCAASVVGGVESDSGVAGPAPAAEVLPVADGDGRVELRVALGDGEVDRVEEVPPVLVRGAVPPPLVVRGADEVVLVDCVGAEFVAMGVDVVAFGVEAVAGAGGAVRGC